MENTLERNIFFSNKIGKELGLTLLNKEFSYGRGIGKADNHCYVNDLHVIFEIEYRQRHPEFNVSKVWPYLENNPNERILLIHYITSTREVSPNRIIHSEWIAKKMVKDLNGRFDYYIIKNEISNLNIQELKIRINK